MCKAAMWKMDLSMKAPGPLELKIVLRFQLE